MFMYVVYSFLFLRRFRISPTNNILEKKFFMFPIEKPLVEDINYHTTKFNVCYRKVLFYSHSS